jgi:hypothetical protein
MSKKLNKTIREQYNGVSLKELIDRKELPENHHLLDGKIIGGIIYYLDSNGKD